MLHQNPKISALNRLVIFTGALVALTAAVAQNAPHPSVLTGQSAFTDASHESPGIRRHLTVADLPDPAPDQSVDNGANIVPRPTPPVSTTRASFASRPTATSSSPRARPAKSRSSAASTPKGIRKKPPSSPRASISPSASPSIPTATIRNGSTSATPTLSCVSPTRTAT